MRSGKKLKGWKKWLSILAGLGGAFVGGMFLDGCTTNPDGDNAFANPLPLIEETLGIIVYSFIDGLSGSCRMLPLCDPQDHAEEVGGPIVLEPLVDAP